MKDFGSGSFVPKAAHVLYFVEVFLYDVQLIEGQLLQNFANKAKYTEAFIFFDEKVDKRRWRGVFTYNLSFLYKGVIAIWYIV